MSVRRELRIIIAGGRDFNDYEYLEKSVTSVIEKFIEVKAQPGIDYKIAIVSGAADGADTLGEKYAGELLNSILYRFPADWTKGKYAGFLRNYKMAKFASEEGTDGILVAFWDGKSKGTANMIENAKNNNLEIHVFKY